MPHVITITGPSGSGKSTTALRLLDHTKEAFKPKLISKYTTRPPRDDDRGEVICVEAIPPRCDLGYIHCGYEYGFESKTLLDSIAAGQSPVIILNDIKTVKEVRALAEGIVKSLFIFRENPSLEHYRDLADLRGVTDEQEPIRRFLTAQEFYHVYHEHIYLFDHVVLNIETLGNRDKQVGQIVKGLEQELRRPLRKESDDKHIPSPRLLIVVSGPDIEKDRLDCAIKDLSPAPIAPLYIPWKRQEGGSNVIYQNPRSPYGIKPSEIWEGLQNGTFQVVAANNPDTVDHFRKVFGELMILTYIYTETNLEERPQVEQKSAAFKVYLENLLAFDHVLIDSGNESDIFSQMYHLLSAYWTGEIGSAIPQALEEKVKKAATNIGKGLASTIRLE